LSELREVSADRVADVVRQVPDPLQAGEDIYKDHGGFEYEQAAYFPEPAYPDGDIQPGQTARGNVAFEVPADIGAMTFVYEPTLQVGDIVQVKLK
jgi:hypothetical protein